MSTSTKFRVSQKKPSVYWGYNATRNNADVRSSFHQLKFYKENHCTEVLQGSKFANTSVACDRENGFVDTVIKCYNGHHNIVLRPDDIWVSILTQFSFYINKNAEKFRGKFVNFDGKRELEVVTQGTLRSVSYASLVSLMSAKIDENLVDPDVKSWILPSFSTTTDNDTVTCGVIFMSTMKKYFDYKFTLDCGIPYVTLEGSVEDWENVSQRLEKLKDYDLLEWYNLLKPILEQFVNAKKGDADVEFWDRICSHHGGGSGPKWISGWLTSFCVFDKDGNWQGGNRVQKLVFGNREFTSDWPIIDTNDIPPGIVEVNVKIDDNGTMHYSSMFAGHLALDILDDGKTLQPISGWIICLKPSPEEITRIEDEIIAKEPWRQREFNSARVE